VYISVEAFLQRFILRKQGVPAAPPAEDRPAKAPASSSEKAAPWKCGVARLDEQNEALFRLIRHFQGALKAGAEHSVMEEVLTSLRGHVDKHLALEEAYLVKISFPGLPEHRQGHRAFLHQIHAFHRRILDRDPSAGLELSQLLFAWLRLHVAKEDSVWSEFAQARRQH
jgi:hemerythrin